MEDGKEKGPEEPEGEVEDEPDDDDGEEPGGRGRGVAVLGGVRAEARALGRWDGLKSTLSHKAKWRTSQITMTEKNPEDEVEASRTWWCQCRGPRCLAVGRVEVDVAAVADEDGLLERGGGAGMAGFLQQGLVLKGMEG